MEAQLMGSSQRDHRYPIYDSTFNLHRLSPIFTGTLPLTNASMVHHAKQFQDILAGDVIRGVRLDYTGRVEVNDRAGPLLEVTWKVLPEPENWNPKKPNNGQDLLQAVATGRGMIVTITYTEMEYYAIMLRSANHSQDRRAESPDETGDFEYLPLLLTRMPNALRQAFREYLESNFDCRVSSQLLVLDKNYMFAALETYLSDLVSPLDNSTTDDRTNSSILKGAIRDVLVTLAPTFITLPDRPDRPHGIGKCDIKIVKEDVPRFVEVGRRRSWTPHEVANFETPFFRAFAYYCYDHLALDIAHETVSIERIACSAFVLGQGRLKLTDVIDDERQARASRRLLDNLVDLAARSPIVST
ncbi:hypothetical protein BP6252_08275 [Coleophoma cylindrospora]|uniref:Uncharacterized protein n=1 Tax=Coleophoma cylindrospora TaxID=1849047 RepID=A0A3D8R5D0_9HELO|nr:hypothetical protein BP6252_08275 [Coleophoma cylindrospora]